MGNFSIINSLHDVAKLITLQNNIYSENLLALYSKYINIR